MVEQSPIVEETTSAPIDKKEPIENMSSAANQPPASPAPGGDDAEETNKRSERKRRREKQRRSDLSNAFDELAAFIVQVEPGVDDDGDKKGKKRKSSDAGEDSAGITRLDLIGRALRIMKRLYRENEERKRVIATMEGRGGGPNDNVIVMVPTLAPSGEESPPVARAAYPGSYQHAGANPYYASAAAPNLPIGGDYTMPPPPPPHHTGYAPHWGAAGYGGRPGQPPAGMPHQMQAQPLRLAQHHLSGRGPLDPNGMPQSHLPPGAQH